MEPQDSLRELALAFPRVVADNDRMRATVELYGRKLRDLPTDVLVAVIDELIKTEKWFPTIATIREACAERMLGLPDEAEALVQIEERLKQVYSGERHPLVPIHPLVLETLKLVGGYSAWRATEDPAVLRGQFGRLYREARSRAIRRLQVEARALEAGERQSQFPRPTMQEIGGPP